jgi:hypothetical protein
MLNKNSFMEPVKDIEKVKRMFAQDQPNLVDTRTGYKYSMVARCPKDDNYAFVARIERTRNSLSKVVFQCPSCSIQFEASQNDIYIC